MTYPRITRVHATALQTSRRADAVLVAHDDGRIDITTPDAFMLGGDGRMVLSRRGLLEDGVRLARGSGRLAPGCGPTLDDIVREANTYLHPAEEKP